MINMDSEMMTAGLVRWTHGIVQWTSFAVCLEDLLHLEESVIL